MSKDLKDKTNIQDSMIRGLQDDLKAMTQLKVKAEATIKALQVTIQENDEAHRQELKKQKERCEREKH
jgi:hypothetical protein